MTYETAGAGAPKTENTRNYLSWEPLKGGHNLEYHPDTCGGYNMAQRVNLDAMIPREDFAVESEEFVLDLFRDFPISYLGPDSPIFKILRKPDFQRETNHWTPDQLVMFLASFLDNEVIPSLILWKSSSFIFVIDGGHRLSALRAWVEDDYGDGPLSQAFYKGEIPDAQKKIARRTRKLIDEAIGRYSALRQLVSSKETAEKAVRRAKLAFTRALPLQWVQGTASVAETSFYKINSQGTPLDETEELLIKNRRKPVAISARAILRSGTGHKYWSSFTTENQTEIEEAARDLYDLLFEPEADSPVRTLDLPLGGVVAPLDALSVLIEFLSIAGAKDKKIKAVAEYEDDEDGNETLAVLKRASGVLKRVTGNSSGSLGLHPAVYFYNERGRHSRFLFLGMMLLIAEKIRFNDDDFFKKFSTARRLLEAFLIENKSLISALFTNMSRAQRVTKARSLFEFLTTKFSAGLEIDITAAIGHLGITGRVLDISLAKTGAYFTDDDKSAAFVERALASAIKCPICQGVLDPKKSVSYDHKLRVRDGGKADRENIQLVHPYCNSAVKG